MARHKKHDLQEIVCMAFFKNWREKKKEEITITLKEMKGREKVKRQETQWWREREKKEKDEEKLIIIFDPNLELR